MWVFAIHYSQAAKHRPTAFHGDGLKCQECKSKPAVYECDDCRNLTPMELKYRFTPPISDKCRLCADCNNSLVADLIKFRPSPSKLSSRTTADLHQPPFRAIAAVCRRPLGRRTDPNGRKLTIVSDFTLIMTKV